MTRRVPLLLTLVPLVAALALYGWLWRGWASNFEAMIARLLPGAQVSATGFPYRLEASLNAPRMTLGETARLTLTADSAVVNQGPWRPELSVIRLEQPRATLAIGPFIGATLEARSALASVNWGEGRLRRQSSVMQAATLGLAGLPLVIRADSLELHLREQTQAPLPATSPRRESRGQLVVGGTRLRIAGGDALTLAAEILATASARLISYDGWAQAGTLELTRLTLSDGHGEVLRAEASLVPDGRQRLRVAGTLETVCPATLAAAFAGQPALPELRLRVAQKLSFEGPLEALQLAPLPDLAGRARRGQSPACPKLRGQ